MALLEQTLTEEEWVQGWFNRSQSLNSMDGARKAIKIFKRFVSETYPSTTHQELLAELRDLPEGDTKLYLFLNKFVQYLSGKNKAPMTVRIYFMFIKSWIRSQGIRVYNEDIRQFVRLPKVLHERGKPLTYEIINRLLGHASSTNTALYLVLASSGMRVGEVLKLTLADLNLGHNPVIVRIRAETTKTREERFTFISSEAKEALLKVIAGKQPSDLVFDSPKKVSGLVTSFFMLRKRAGLDERQRNGQHTITLHTFRSFFLTMATKKHGENYAHALIGHHKYLDQYFRETVEDQGKKYLELEPDLTINNDARNKLIIDKQGKEIAQRQNLEAEVQKLKYKIERMEKSKLVV